MPANKHAIKTIVITGGTAGIGLAAARALARRGHRLILIGRDEARGRSAIGMLPPAQGRAHRFLAADLSLMENVRATAVELKASEAAIDVLANNAGTWFQHRDITAEGIERTVAINHLAYIGMTVALKPLLAVAPGARVINTGSFVYRQARYDPLNLQAEKRFSTNATYAATKLYNLMATRALAHRWADAGIAVNCFSPGFVATDFGKGEGGFFEPYYRFIRLFASRPEKGAATLVRLADTPENGLSGAYLANGRPRAVKGAATDMAKCNALLDWSIRMAGFNPDTV